MYQLLVLLAVSLAINITLFIPAFVLKTDKLTDLSYSLSFVVLAFYAYLSSVRSVVQSLLFASVILWAVRLGGFLLLRIYSSKRDLRFDGVRENFWLFLRFWLLQALSVFVIMVPVLLVLQHDLGALKTSMLPGIVIFVLGLIIEATADLQKYRFNHQLANKGRWIASGLWHYSRHPNYLGEMLVWIGLYLAAVPYLSAYLALIGLISPIFICGLLLFVSGIPLLEKSADVRWGTDKSYIAYKKRTALLIPGWK